MSATCVSQNTLECCWKPLDTVKTVLSWIYDASLLGFHSDCLSQALLCCLCDPVPVCIMQLLVVAVLSVPLCLYFRVLRASWQQGLLIQAGMSQLAANMWGAICTMGQWGGNNILWLKRNIKVMGECIFPDDRVKYGFSHWPCIKRPERPFTECKLCFIEAIIWIGNLFKSPLFTKSKQSQKSHVTQSICSCPTWFSYS